MKISIIMQSYLGEYPGSRKNPSEKFIRSVYSVINQSIDTWELIIVSDGCNITETIYNNHFKNYNNIKFFKISKPIETNMYSNGNYRRGIPKQVGLEKATGDWVIYLDTDDIILKNAIFKLNSIISNSVNISIEKNLPELKYILNSTSIYHYKKLLDTQNIKTSAGQIYYEQRGDVFKIEGLPDTWVSLKTRLEGSNVDVSPNVTNCIIHKRGFPIWKWKDTNETNTSEDISYISKLFNENDVESILHISFPYYVKCFERNNWDC
jgi:glycosyltransferase involved in cell wall biosynthesis